MQVPETLRLAFAAATRPEVPSPTDVLELGRWLDHFGLSRFGDVAITTATGASTDARNLLCNACRSHDRGHPPEYRAGCEAQVAAILSLIESRPGLWQLVRGELARFWKKVPGELAEISPPPAGADAAVKTPARTRLTRDALDAAAILYLRKHRGRERSKATRVRLAELAEAIRCGKRTATKLPAWIVVRQRREAQDRLTPGAVSFTEKVDSVTGEGTADSIPDAVAEKLDREEALKKLTAEEREEREKKLTPAQIAERNKLIAEQKADLELSPLDSSRHRGPKVSKRL
jgi:hypothetical protein